MTRLSTSPTVEHVTRIVYGVGMAVLTVAGRVFYPRLRLAVVGLATALRRKYDHE